jgi:hypothetical protein
MKLLNSQRFRASLALSAGLVAGCSAGAQNVGAPSPPGSTASLTVGAFSDKRDL